MPEGDSVYRLRQRLDVLCGLTVQRGELRVPKHATADLAGHELVEHDTYGKHLLTRFSGGLTLHTHLRMDGSWTIVRPGRHLPRKLDDDIHVLLAFVDGPTAYGLTLPVVELIATDDEHEVIGHLGPDPLRADWDPAEAAARLSRDPDRPVAAAMLDQTLVAGWGNLWVNELCFLRGVSPWTAIGQVDVERLVALGARALRASATGVAGYQITTGNTRRGEQHWVAGRAGRPCLRCGTTVRVAGETATERRTWWCPHCQPGAVRTTASSASAPS